MRNSQNGCLDPLIPAARYGSSINPFKKRYSQKLEIGPIMTLQRYPSIASKASNKGKHLIFYHKDPQEKADGKAWTGGGWDDWQKEAAEDLYIRFVLPSAAVVDDRLIAAKPYLGTTEGRLNLLEVLFQLSKF